MIPGSLLLHTRETTVIPMQLLVQRWLHVVSHTDPRYGGLSTAVPSLAASLGAQPGCDTALAAFCLPGEQVRPNGLRTAQISFYPTSRVAWWRDRTWEADLARRVEEVDALHIHGLWEQSTAVACRLARKLGKPYILSAHGMLEPWALAAKKRKKQVYAALVERRNVAGAACLHALTPAEAEQYRRFGATCPIAVVPNGVAVPSCLSSGLFLERFPALRGRRLVLFLSRLHPKKGLDLLVTAWGKLHAQYPETTLVLAGPDSDGFQASLAQQCQTLGMESQVCFTGMLAGDLKWSALQAASLYVLPSYSEGLPMALLEAMAAGLPVLATRNCNLPEITSDDAGWEIAAEAEALEAALGSALACPSAVLHSKGSHGARLITSHYTPERVLHKMAEVYRFVLGGRAPATLVPRTGGTQ